MYDSIKDELINHILAGIDDEIINDDNVDKWHGLLFNESLYITYYSTCKQWLIKHDLDTLAAIDMVSNYLTDNFGEVNISKYTDYESLVNMVAYIIGEDILQQARADTIEELKAAIDPDYEEPDEYENEDEDD